MVKPELPSLLSPPRNDAPWWVVPLLTFALGFAIAAAVLMPTASTPDYQRGYKVGFDAAWNERSTTMSQSDYNRAFMEGVQHGLNSVKRQ